MTCSEKVERQTMNTISHHLTENVLAAYAAGTLPEAFNLIVATHISMCDECRADLHAHEALGGAVLEGVGSVDMASDALTACMARISAASEVMIKADVRPLRASRSDPIFPQPLRDYVGGGLSDVKWRSAGMGVKQAILPTSRDATVRLLYIPAGAEVPDHGHNGIEMTLVLQGAFRDAFSRFAAGDIEICDTDVEHKPVAEEGQACICLAATVAPLKFSGIFPKIAQPFLRI